MSLAITLGGATLLVLLPPSGALFSASSASTASLNEASDASEQSVQSLTLQRVAIDPLGAPEDTPWQINIGSLNVRSAPSIEADILGSVTRGTKVHGAYVLVEESDEEWLEIDFLGQTGYLFRLGFSRIHPKNTEMIERYGNLPFGREIVNRWWGIPLDYEADDLVSLPPEYTRQVENVDYQLRREAAESLVEMMDAMREDGLEMYVSSAYRSGERQQTIYRRSTGRDSSQRRTAPPGHSEHQLGVTVDLSSLQERGRSLRNTDPQHEWLTANAARFGWRQTYLADNIHETGYIEEPWHWRYIGREATASGAAR